MSTGRNEAAPRRTLIMVHGGSAKPGHAELQALWTDALAAGLARDFKNRRLDEVDVQLAYYGDLLEPLLEQTGKKPDLRLDLEDRRRDLRRLAEISSKKRFRRAQYEAVPGKSAVGELVADVAAPVLHALRLTEPVLARREPSLAAYLARDPTLREACEARLMTPLRSALERGDDVLLLTHAMGSVVAYDTLWRLSCEPAEVPRPEQRVRAWVTCGSPLASEYVKRRLRGAREPVARRYPDQVIDWYNVAAEDDYHCHDKTVADDFAGALKQRRLSHIRDHRIFNLAVRYGRSNPHNAVGYLIHPRVSRLVADWLGEPTG